MRHRPYAARPLLRLRGRPPLPKKEDSALRRRAHEAQRERFARERLHETDLAAAQDEILAVFSSEQLGAQGQDATGRVAAARALHPDRLAPLGHGAQRKGIPLEREDDLAIVGEQVPPAEVGVFAAVFPLIRARKGAQGAELGDRTSARRKGEGERQDRRPKAGRAARARNTGRFRLIFPPKKDIMIKTDNAPPKVCRRASLLCAETGEL